MNKQQSFRADFIGTILPDSDGFSRKGFQRKSLVRVVY